MYGTSEYDKAEKFIVNINFRFSDKYLSKMQENTNQINKHSLGDITAMKSMMLYYACP